MRVTAAVLDGSGSDPVLTEVELDSPRADEVLVRLTSVGICGTDLHFATEVPAPAVLGHEGAGVVEQVGDQVTHVAPGDKVLLHFSWCGHCDHCMSGAPSYCRSFDALNFGGRRADGSSTIDVAGTPAYASFLGQSSFATHAVVSGRSVVRLPDDLDLDPIGPLGCGLMTGAGAVLNVLRPTAGDVVGVIVSLGGQTPLKLADSLPKDLVLGTVPDSIDLAEDRDRWNALCARLEIPQPAGGTATDLEGADDDFIGAGLIPHPH